MVENVYMVEQRNNARFQSFAKVIIHSKGKKQALLKDISITGCRVESVEFAEIEPKAQYKLKIIPEEASEIGTFNLVVEAKWSGAMVDSYEYGFCITGSPKGRQFQRYVDYLSWRYSQGKSMTSDAGEEVPQTI
jgi:hypothetical protein